MKSVFNSVTGQSLKKYGKFVKMTQYLHEKKNKTVDKIKLAHETIKSEPDWDVYDLKAKVEELVKKICEANKMEILNPQIKQQI